MASITQLPVKTLVKVLKDLRGGDIGFDPYRDDRTRSKEKLLAFILANYTNTEIIAAISRVTDAAQEQDKPEGIDANLVLPVDNQALVYVRYQDLNGQEHYQVCHSQEDANTFIHNNPSNHYLGRMTPEQYEAHKNAIAVNQGIYDNEHKLAKRKGVQSPIVPDAPQAEALPDPRLQALQALLTPALDESKVKAICDARAAQYIDNLLESVNVRLTAYDGKIEALTNKKPLVEKIIIEQAGKPNVEIKEHVNPAFHEIVAIAGNYPNIMLVGPAGCGKTHLARQVSLALGKSFSTISGSAGISESHFTGRLLPTGDGGKFEYTESPFISEYSKDDGCFLIDEFDALDPNCIMVCQGATANGGFTVEARKAAGLDPFVKRGSNALLMASANTYGTGADSLYVGRFQQDAAANDRWYFIPVDYDRDLESKLAPDDICDWVWSLRDKVQEHKIRRVVSTRMIQKAAAARLAKRPIKEIRERMLAGWTKEERSKCGV